MKYYSGFKDKQAVKPDSKKCFQIKNQPEILTVSSSANTL